MRTGTGTGSKTLKLCLTFHGVEKVVVHVWLVLELDLDLERIEVAESVCDVERACEVSKYSILPKLTSASVLDSSGERSKGFNE